MRVLLDTHVVLWALSAPERLGSQRSRIEDPSTARLFSAVVAWEVAIKVGLRRLDVPQPLSTWLARVRTELAVEPCPVTAQQAIRVAELPGHHHDPFDRLLVAQATELGVPLVTADAQLAAYDVEILRISGRS
ncbi:MAG: type II toxin-antitoxin system VapC family toxin [Egibacteraceae bacterium]